MIIGRDMLRRLGVKTDFEDETVTVDEETRDMRPHPDARLFGAVPPAEALHFQIIDELDDEAWSHPERIEGPPNAASFNSDTFATMGDSTCDAADLDKVVAECSHLDSSQKSMLLNTLKRFPKPFDGVLRHCNGGEIHLDIDPTVPPKQVRHCPIAHTNLGLFKRELDRPVKVGVPEKSGRSEWISGTFITPKKDGEARWVSDFRALNKAIKRKVHPLPKIQDVLLRRSGHKFCAKIDLSMQCHTFMLDKESRAHTTIATPFGLHRHCRLPMGISQSPDVAQEIMENVLDGIENIECHLDDIAVFSPDCESHVTTLAQVFERLESSGFAVNPLKCEWATQETDFPGHWLAPTGPKPWRKKIDAILKLQPPANINQLRSFLGMVTCHRDVWPRRSHILTPIAESTGTREFVWNERCQRAFDEMKAPMASDTLLRCPDHDKPFHVETDASDCQLGGVIEQDGQPVAHCTRKLNSAQKNHSAIDKELLSVVEILREFRTMLLGAELHVHTDHKNPTHQLSAFQTQRIMRWRLLLEEFNPSFHHKEGKLNCVADALSRLPEDVERPPVDEPPAEVRREAPEREAFLVDDETADCLLFHPDPIGQNAHPFRFADIATMQNASQGLVGRLTSHPDRCQRRTVAGHDVIAFILNNQDPDSWRIALPDTMVRPVVEHFHQATVHAQGASRLDATMRRFCCHPTLTATI